MSWGVFVWPELIFPNYGWPDPLWATFTVVGTTGLVAPKCAPSMRGYFSTCPGSILLTSRLNKPVATKVNLRVAEFTKSLDVSLSDLSLIF
jgi:hypothetical protein